VITNRCYEEAVVRGEEIKGEFHVAALYVLHGNQWKLSLWQITPVAA
jgi:hypothetical protein